MVATDPLWLPTLSYDETELRKMDLPFIMSDGTALGGRGGIRPGDTGLAVTLAGTTVNVSAGAASVFRSGQGVYRAQLAATSPGTLAAANATFSRIDLVYLRVWDTAVDATGLRKADTVYLAGTASASPVAPTPGASEIYIPLATITVPSTGGGGTGAATVSSTVRQITVAPGGVLPVSSAADIAISGAYTGQVRYNTVRATLETWNGSAWVAPGDWTTYTPTWTGSGSNPAIGNGSLTGEYRQLGKSVLVNINLTVGSTTTFGSGTYSYSLPFAAATRNFLGPALAIDSGSAVYTGEAYIGSGASVINCYSPTGASGASPTSWSTANPMTWAVNDSATIQAEYRIP